METFLLRNRAPEPWADAQNDPVSPEMRRLWTESDALIAAQDREARRATLRGDCRAILWGLAGGGLFILAHLWLAS